MRGVAAHVAAPGRPLVNNAEEHRLQHTDAFAELVDMNYKKQSVNRPQKVQHGQQ